MTEFTEEQMNKIKEVSGQYGESLSETIQWIEMYLMQNNNFEDAIEWYQDEDATNL